MKKIAKLIGLMLALIIVMSSVVIPSFAEGEGYLTYTEYSSYAKLTKCLSGARGTISIPSTYNGLPVKVIGNGAFSDCSLITKVTIPSSVTTVEQNAFNSCTSLKEITFNGTVCEIGSAAFIHCSSLESIKLPSALTEIPAEAFYDCMALASISIPSTVTTIGKEAFKMCASLAYVGIPASVKTIRDNAFLGCSKVENFYVAPENTVYSSSNGCLYGPFESPYDSELSNPVTDKAFIQYPNAKTATSYTVESGTLRIADYAFGDNKYLTKIVLPAGLKGIDDFAFYNCTALNDISIPSTVTTIGSQAFGKTTALKSITVPGSVASLENVFYASGVQSVVLQNGVKTIGTRCFENCKNLTSVTIPDSVTSIGDYAFYSCDSLTSIIIPDSVTSIGEKAFYDTAYYNDAINWKNDVLYIDNHLIKAKDTISGSYEIKSGTLTIADDAFCYCDGLTNITIPDNATSIGKEAFYSCDSLTSVTIPDSVKSIGSSAFSNCTSLTSVTIPDSVKSIGSSTFSNCTSLASVTIPSSVTKIGIGAFYDCVNLQSLLVPDSVTSIGGSAFSGCSKLTLKVYAGSKALEYAQKNSIPYEIVDPSVTPSVGVSEITVYAYPSKTSYYYKENVDTSGLVLLVVKEDGTTDYVNSGYTISPSKLTKTGSVKVDVNYGGCSTYFNVEVSYAWWQWLIRIFLLGILWY